MTEYPIPNPQEQMYQQFLTKLRYTEDGKPTVEMYMQVFGQNTDIVIEPCFHRFDVIQGADLSLSGPILFHPGSSDEHIRAGFRVKAYHPHNESWITFEPNEQQLQQTLALSFPDSTINMNTALLQAAHQSEYGKRFFAYLQAQNMFRFMYGELEWERLNIQHAGTSAGEWPNYEAHLRKHGLLQGDCPLAETAVKIDQQIVAVLQENGFTDYEIRSIRNAHVFNLQEVNGYTIEEYETDHSDPMPVSKDLYLTVYCEGTHEDDYSDLNEDERHYEHPITEAQWDEVRPHLEEAGYHITKYATYNDVSYGIHLGDLGSQTADVVFARVQRIVSELPPLEDESQFETCIIIGYML